MLGDGREMTYEDLEDMEEKDIDKFDQRPVNLGTQQVKHLNK